MGTVIPEPTPVHPGAMLPPDVFKEIPWLVMKADRLSALLEMSERTFPPPIAGGVVSTDAMKMTDTLASTKIITFVMMSR